MSCVPPLHSSSALVAPWAGSERSLLPIGLTPPPGAVHPVDLVILYLCVQVQLYGPNSCINTNTVTMLSAFLTYGEKKVVKETELHKISMYRGIQSFRFVSASGSTDHSTWSVWGAVLRQTWWGSEPPCGQYTLSYEAEGLKLDCQVWILFVTYLLHDLCQFAQPPWISIFSSLKWE